MEKSKYQCKNIVPSSHTTDNLSRYELLKWINESFNLRLKDVESMSTGSIYCQFMDRLFPGSISLKRVKMHPTVPYEYILNFKQLQNAFRAVGCEKDVPIDRLVQGRFQENFEFLQWFRRFYEINSESEFITDLKKSERKSEKKKTKTQTPSKSADVGACSSKEKELKDQLADLKEKADVLEKERVFFYNKLRNIEQLCTGEDGEAADLDKATLLPKILSELYATDEDLPSEADQSF